MGEAGSGLIWLGWAMSWFAVIVFAADGLFQIFGRAIAPGPFLKMMEMGEMRPELGVPCGILVLGSAILYAIPATAVLGAILLTGFLGGAILTDLRVSGPGRPPQIVSVILGFITWGGLYFMDDRIRALIPFVS